MPLRRSRRSGRPEPAAADPDGSAVAASSDPGWALPEPQSGLPPATRPQPPSAPTPEPRPSPERSPTPERHPPEHSPSGWPESHPPQDGPAPPAPFNDLRAWLVAVAAILAIVSVLLQLAAGTII